MAIHLRLPLLVLALVTGCWACSSRVTPQSKAARQSPRLEVSLQFDPWIALAGRHPEILADETFQQWHSREHLGGWTESALDSERHRNVVALNAVGSEAFVARSLMSVEPVLRMKSEVHLLAAHNSRADVLRRLEDAGIPFDKIRMLEPMVSFGSDQTPLVKWRVEVDRGGGREVFEFANDELTGPLTLPVEAELEDGRPMSSAMGSDELATNELHHPAAFKGVAETAIAGKTLTKERARAIFDVMKDSYSYSDSTPGIQQFTWADLLVDGNNKTGICDELSVVLISHLRAAEIPARLRLLVITLKDHPKPAGHAVVEYRDGREWRHADVLFGFNKPSVYRKIIGVQGVTVMTATFPDDTRSVAPWLKLPDPSGDGKLNPLGDFLLSSRFPGLPEPEYSN